MPIDQAGAPASTGAARHILLLTGRPGVGKTTVIRSVAAQLTGWRLAGFYTEEIRDASGRRTGFRALTLEGRKRAIADARAAGPHRVGKYAVDVGALDELAQEELQLEQGIDLYLIDEIGKMECLSAGFVRAVARLLDSPRPILATVGARGTGLIAEVKRRSDADLWEVTPDNRQDLPRRILVWLGQD